MHDPTVDRTTNGKGKVKNLTFKEIKSLKTKNGETIPTLKKVLAYAKKQNAGVYLDTKEKSISALQKMVELVKEYQMEDKVIFGLWHLNQLKWLENNYPELVSCISFPFPALTLEQAKRYGADWVGTLIALATKFLIKRAHRLKLKVITMPINDIEIMKKKYQLGIDAIQTDDPRLISRFKSELEEVAFSKTR